jgi:hypothetical protein
MLAKEGYPTGDAPERELHDPVLVVHRSCRKTSQANRKNIENDISIPHYPYPVSTEIIHVLFSNIKTWLNGTFHGVSAKHLPRYLTEWNYRFDRRGMRENLDTSVLRRAVGPRSPTPILSAGCDRKGRVLWKIGPAVAVCLCPQAAHSETRGRA